jgi:hypothetical protein
MPRLMRMMLTLIGTALLNKMLKGSIRPSTNSDNGNQANYLKALQNIMLALLFSRSRIAWLIIPATISATKLLFTSFISSLNKGYRARDQIIETNDYKIVDETRIE